MNISPAIIARYNEAHIDAEWISPGDEVVAKNIADVLEKQYPGYLWMVHVSVRTGLIDIKNMLLTGKYGYTIKLTGLFSWDSLRDKVIQAGGEILERYDMPRSRFDAEKFGALERGFNGLPIGDLSR